MATSRLSDASSAGPAGSIASDSISLAHWWRAYCAGEIVSEASLTEMSTFVGGPDGYGLGLFNVADPWGFGVGHTGGNFGYSSWAGCMPGDHAVVVVVLTDFWVDDLGGLPRPLVMAALSGVARPRSPARAGAHRVRERTLRTRMPGPRA